MTTSSPKKPVMACPSWCGSHVIDRDKHDDERGGYVTHASRQGVVFVHDGHLDDPFDNYLEVRVETTTYLFTGETVRNYAIPDTPTYVMVNGCDDVALSPGQARGFARELEAAADLAEGIR